MNLLHVFNDSKNHALQVNIFVFLYSIALVTTPLKLPQKLRTLHLHLHSSHLYSSIFFFIFIVILLLSESTSFRQWHLAPNRWGRCRHRSRSPHPSVPGRKFKLDRLLLYVTPSWLENCLMLVSMTMTFFLLLSPFWKKRSSLLYT